MVSRNIMAAFAFALALLLVFGCAGGAQSEKNLIPGKASGYATVMFQQVLAASSLPAQVGNANAAKSIDDLKTELQTKYDIDIASVTKVIMFFNFDDHNYMGVILRGTFDQAKLTAKLSSTGATKQAYNGVDMYASQDGTTATAFVNNAVVLGEPQAVKDVIDVDAGTSQPLDNPDLNNAQSRVNGNAMVVVSGIVPLSFKQSSGASASAAMSFMNDVNAFSVSFDKSGNQINVKAAMQFSSADNASKAGDSLQEMVTMLSGFAKSGSATESLLKSIKITNDGTYVMLDLQTTDDVSKQVNTEMNTTQPSTVQ